MTTLALLILLSASALLFAHPIPHHLGAENQGTPGTGVSSDPASLSEAQSNSQGGRLNRIAPTEADNDFDWHSRGIWPDESYYEEWDDDDEASYTGYDNDYDWRSGSALTGYDNDYDWRSESAPTGYDNDYDWRSGRAVFPTGEGMHDDDLDGWGYETSNTGYDNDYDWRSGSPLASEDSNYDWRSGAELSADDVDHIFPWRTQSSNAGEGTGPDNDLYTGTAATDGHAS